MFWKKKHPVLLDRRERDIKGWSGWVEEDEARPILERRTLALEEGSGQGRSSMVKGSEQTGAEEVGAADVGAKING